VRPDDLTVFLRETLEVLRDQRTSIAARDWVGLERALDRLRDVMGKVASIPGGSQRLRSSIEALDGSDRDGAQVLLEQIQAERQASSELIRLNLQRFQSLEAMFSLDAASARNPNADTPGFAAGRRLSKWV